MLYSPGFLLPPYAKHMWFYLCNGCGRPVNAVERAAEIGLPISQRNCTCLQHLLNAESGMLGGAIWSRTPPVVLNRGMTSMNTATDTSPRHKTSAFLTLEHRNHKTLAEQNHFISLFIKSVSNLGNMSLF